MFNEGTYKRLRMRLKIDALRLTEEMIEMPSLFQEAAECTADAIAIRDGAKRDADITAARIAIEVGKEMEKPTQAKVDAAVSIHIAVTEANELLDDAKRDAAYWMALTDSMRERSSLLRRIAEMTVSGYLSPNAAYEERKAEMTAARLGSRENPRPRPRSTNG
jgi:hypothetical protein